MGSHESGNSGSGGAHIVSRSYDNLQQMKHSSFWTRTKAFKRLTKWAFGVCDRNKSGEINKTELYAGLVLVHLNLAKYVGPAACFPPSRDTVDKLFDASDDNNSGGIDEEEFNQIMIVPCSEITGRIVTYYTILILAVPYLVSAIIHFLDILGVDETVRAVDKNVWEAYAPALLQRLTDMIPDSTWESLPQTLTSTALFYMVIPMTWNFIDVRLHRYAERTSVVEKAE